MNEEQRFTPGLCNCEALVTIQGGHEGIRFIGVASIEYCPLHGAAPEMYEALKDIRAAPVGGPLMDAEMEKIRDLLKEIDNG